MTIAPNCLPNCFQQQDMIGMRLQPRIHDRLHSLLPAQEFRGGRCVRRSAFPSANDGARYPRSHKPAFERQFLKPQADDAEYTRSHAADLPHSKPNGHSLCPFMIFVRLSSTKSAPSSSGRQSTGEANVLSTSNLPPLQCAISASDSISATRSVGLLIVSTTTSFDFLVMASAVALRSEVSATLQVIPNRSTSPASSQAFFPSSRLLMTT